jgi:hypothetical protein
MNHYGICKTEYTNTLTKIIVPFIYEGFLSIYSDAKKIVKKGEENKLLKIFQQMIRNIPKWKDELVEAEANRIFITSKRKWLHNLLKAVIKANMILLSNSSNTITNSTNIEEYLNIPFDHFIHRCYIESAKEIYNSPFLFYHKISSIEIKRNQRDAKALIRTAIEEAVRKMLPYDYILENYLKDEKPEDVDFDNAVSEHDKNNVERLINNNINNVPVNNFQTQSVDKIISYENTTRSIGELAKLVIPVVQQAGNVKEDSATSNLINDVKNKYLENVRNDVHDTPAKSRSKTPEYRSPVKSRSRTPEHRTPEHRTPEHRTPVEPHNNDDHREKQKSIDDGNYEAVFSNSKRQSAHSRSDNSKSINKSIDYKSIDNKTAATSKSNKSDKKDANTDNKKNEYFEKYYSIG